MLNTNLRLLDLLIRLGLVRRVTAPTGLALYEGPHVYSGQLEYASRHRATGRRTRSAVVDADSLADVADGSVPPLLSSAQVCLFLHVADECTVSPCPILSAGESEKESESELKRRARTALRPRALLCLRSRSRGWSFRVARLVHLIEPRAAACTAAHSLDTSVRRSERSKSSRRAVADLYLTLGKSSARAD